MAQLAETKDILADDKNSSIRLVVDPEKMVILVERVNRKLDFSMRKDLSDKEFKTTLSGLANFYVVGVWATAMCSLAHNASSGKAVIQRI